MAVAIMISTFGCNNGLILAGARVYYAMARDGLFFRCHRQAQQPQRAGGRLGPCSASGPRCSSCRARGCATRSPARPLLDAAGLEQYGNLYSTLLDYVIFAVLIFYVLTIAGLFVLRRKRPDAERPYRAFGYPVVPALYIAAASAIMTVLLALQDPDLLAGPAHRPGRRARLFPVETTRRDLNPRQPSGVSAAANVAAFPGNEQNSYELGCLEPMTFP